MKSKEHLNYDELLLIYKYISLNYSIKKVCQLIDINRSTLYRLIINNSNLKGGYATKVISSRFKNCRHLIKCKENGLIKCPASCSNYKKYFCPKLLSYPYICNFCKDIDKCYKEKRLFNPEIAIKMRRYRNVESKSSPNITTKELKEFNESFSPLIKQGLSVEAVMNELKNDYEYQTRTVRNWINKGYLDVKRHDLRNAVTRYYKKDYEYKRVSKNPLMKVGRTYSTYLEYIKDKNLFDVTQFDTVHGLMKDKCCLLTIHHPSTKFQIGIKLNGCTPSYVNDAMILLRRKLGDDLYFRFFRIMLCDNGIEFDNMINLEKDLESGEIYGKVFFTRPYRSGDKGSCEKNHEFFRYFYPKKKSLDALTQEEIDEIFSRINSYPRKSLNFATPLQLMSKYMGNEFLSKLNIREIPFKKIILKR